MIVMSQIYIDRLNSCPCSDDDRSSFNRIVFNTRFEKYSDFIWERLNMLKNSFTYNLDENTWENYSTMINSKKNLAETFLMLTNNMTRNDNGIAITDRTTGKLYLIDKQSFMTEMYCTFRYLYCTEVDRNFNKRFTPRDYKNTIIYTNGCDPKTLIENQKKSIKSIQKTIESLGKDSQNIPEYYSPSKNIKMHAAMAVMMTVCEPNYDPCKINEAIDCLDRINQHRGGKTLQNIRLDDIIFGNKVEFTNNEYRVIYDIFKLVGLIRVNEECESRNSSNYIRSVHEQAKNVEMLCIYDVFHGINAKVNHKKIAQQSELYRCNDSFLQTDRLNVDFAFAQ